MKLTTVYCAMLSSLMSFSVFAETKANIEVSAVLAKGCSIDKVAQSLDFDRHPSYVQSYEEASISNTVQSWGIRCTAGMPVQISLNAGQNSNNAVQRRLKHRTQNHYIPYALYQDSAKKNPYEVGQQVELSSTTTQDSVLKFSIFAVADLHNNFAPRPSGIYEDSIAITITW